MVLPVHQSARLQLIMYPQIDLAAGTIVGRNDKGTAGRLGVLPRDGGNTLIVSFHLMYSALLIKTLDSGSYLSACQLFDDLLQLWIALPNNVIQRGRPHPCLLQLREWTACFNGLMLAAVSYQQHTIIPMETFDEFVHLARGRQRRLIEYIQALLSRVGLRPFRKMTLES
jgi:hypothetical protein